MTEKEAEKRAKRLDNAMYKAVRALREMPYSEVKLFRGDTKAKNTLNELCELLKEAGKK